METSPQPGSPSCSPLQSLAQVEAALTHLSSIDPLASVLAALQPAQLYLVGGTVRDAFSTPTGTDIDIATDLPPAEVQRRCHNAGLKTVETGIEHGTVLAVVHDVHVEITTFRHPSDRHTHHASGSIEVDLSGRDFTINAIAFDLLERRLYDPFQGSSDLAAGVVRAVGDAPARLLEDPLRILRMVRFGPAMGRVIEPATANAAKELTPHLASVSVERIKSELDKILLAPFPHLGIRTLLEIGALPYTIPELLPAVGFEQNRYHIHDVFDHTLSVLKRTPADSVLRWSAIFHDIGKPHTLSVDAAGNRHFYLHEVVSARLSQDRMRTLRFSHQEAAAIATVVREHMRPLDCGPAGVRRLLRDLGESFQRWRLFKAADASPTLPEAEFERSAENFDRMVEQERARQAAAGGTQLAINGHDVLDQGVPAGPAVGKVLRALAELIIEDPARNTREWLLEELARRAKATGTGAP